MKNGEIEYNKLCADCIYTEECGEPHYTTIIRCPRYLSRKNTPKKSRNRGQKNAQKTPPHTESTESGL